MAEVERTFTVATPIADVWRFVADFTTTEEWDPPTVSSIRTGGDGGVGTTYHNVSKFLGRKTEVDFEVTECVEQRRLRLAGTGARVAVLDTITLAPTAEGGTTLTYHAAFAPRDGAELEESFRPPALGELADVVALSLQDSLEHL